MRHENGQYRFCGKVTDLNNFPVTSKGIGDALLRSASALSSANNGLDESIALITAANAVVQDPDKVGTSLKTISMFLRAAKTEAEDAGVSTEGMAQSVSKLREELLALTGGKVDIMLDEKTFKSTYQIMKELAGVWGQLSDITQANIIEKIGGKRQANIVSSLLQNFSMAEEVLATSADSAGSALAENEKYLDSITGRIGVLKATYQEFANHILSSDLVKFLVSGMTKIFDLFNVFDGKLAGGIVKIILFTTGLKLVYSLLSKINIVNMIINKQLMMNSILSKGKGLLAVLSGVQGKLVAIAAIIGVLGYAAYKMYRKSHPTLEQIKEDYSAIESDLKELNTTLDENKKRIEEIEKLKREGKASLVEEEELDALKRENDFLKKQIEYNEILAKHKKELISDTASQKVSEFFAPLEEKDESSGYVTYNYEGTVNELKTQMHSYKEAKQNYEKAMAEGNSKGVMQYKDDMMAAQDSIIAFEETLVALKKDLDPSDVEANKQLDIILAQIDYMFFGIEAIDSIWKKLWSEDSPVKGAQEAAAEFERAALAWKNGETAPLIGMKEKYSDVFAGVVAYLEEIGVITEEKFGDVFGDTDEELELFANAFLKVKEAAEETGDSLSGFFEDYEKLSDKLKVLTEAKENAGSSEFLPTADLQAIMKAFPEMSSYVDEYLSGLITAKELLDEIEDSYEDDKEAYLDSLADKRMASEDFYKRLKASQNSSLATIAASYHVELEQFTTMEQLKDQINSELLKNLAKKRSIYVGMDLEELKARAVQLSRFIHNSIVDRSELKQELSEVNSAISEMESLDKRLSEIAINGAKVPPISFKEKDNKNKESKTEDKYKKNVDDEIAKIKHQYEMEQITKEEYLQKLSAIENKYYLNSAANRKKYAKEIRSIDEELFKGRREIFTDWINDQTRLAETASAVGNLSQTREIYDAILEETYKMIDQAKAYGLDESSDYVQELRDQAKKTAQDILNTVKKGFDDFENYADTFNIWDSLDFTKMDFLKAQLKEIEDLYASGMLAWHDYIREYNEVAGKMYDIQKDSIETIIDMTMEMIQQEAEDKKKALEEQIDDYKEIIELKKKMLQETNNEQDYEKKTAKIVEEIAKLQSKIAQLSLDDSREALADRIALEEQLAEKQNELNDLQHDHALDNTLDTLDKSQDAFEKEKKEEIDTVDKSVDTWAKRYQQAIDRIDNDWDNLYVDLQDWMDEHRSSIDGPDSLKTSWENVIALKEKYKDLGGIEDIYNGMGNGMGIDPNAPKSEQAQQILEQMKQNSLTALRNPGSAAGGLNTANKKLAEQYYQLTGQRLHQGTDLVWRYDGPNGTEVYDLLGPVAEQNPYTSGRAQFGDTDSDAVRWAQYQLRGANYSQPVDGNFWQTTKKNILAFQKRMRIKETGQIDAETIKRLKAYHSGGIVDGTGAINDREVVAVLERGEWVLDKKKQSAVKSLISNMFGFIDSVTSSNLASKINPLKNTVVGHGDTFAPHVEVNITHNGKMTDADARKYGKMAGDVALEELRTAFKKRGM